MWSSCGTMYCTCLVWCVLCTLCRSILEPIAKSSSTVYCTWKTKGNFFFELVEVFLEGMWWPNWLRHCATSLKVAGSIPDDVIEIFHWRNLSGRTIALGLTQSLKEITTRNISWGVKGGRCVVLTTSPPSCADCLEIWEPQTPGNLRACPDL